MFFPSANLILQYLFTIRTQKDFFIMYLICDFDNKYDYLMVFYGIARSRREILNQNNY